MFCPVYEVVCLDLRSFRSVHNFFCTVSVSVGRTVTPVAVLASGNNFLAFFVSSFFRNHSSLCMVCDEQRTKTRTGNFITNNFTFSSQCTTIMASVLSPNQVALLKKGFCHRFFLPYVQSYIQHGKLSFLCTHIFRKLVALNIFTYRYRKLR